MALAKEGSSGQVTFRPDSVQTRVAAWEVGEGPSSATPLYSSPLWVSRSMPTRKTWREAEAILWNGQGLLQKHLSPWLRVSTTFTLFSRIGNGERRSAPSLGPGLVGCVLILVGTPVLSKNIRDPWQGLRRNEN